MRPLSGGWVSDQRRDVLDEEKHELVLESNVSTWCEVFRDPRRTILALDRKCRLIAHPQNPVYELANDLPSLDRSTTKSKTADHIPATKRVATLIGNGKVNPKPSICGC